MAKHVEKKEEEKKDTHKEVQSAPKENAVQLKKSTVLAVSVAIIMLIIGFAAGYLVSGALNTGASAGLDKNVVGQRVINYLNDNLVEPGTNASLVSVEEQNGVYKITTSYQGQEIDIYATTDGSSLFLSQPVSLNTTTTTGQQTGQNTNTGTGNPKSDKPVVELFVMSYCPYGTQAEKGILPAVNALGDKIDFKLRFVFYAMHPSSGEVEENLRQYCIQKDQPEKFIKYLACFLNASNSPSCLISSGIDSAQLESCYSAADAQFEISKNLNDRSLWLSGSFPLFSVDAALNQQYDVQGSPTLIINGVKSSAGRDSASYLRAICAAFIEAPAECSEQLSSTQPGPGFGYDSTGSAQAAGCGV